MALTGKKCKYTKHSEVLSDSNKGSETKYITNWHWLLILPDMEFFLFFVSEKYQVSHSEIASFLY